MRTRVKICGITRVEDGIAAAEAGADAIGLVFYPDSPRAVTIQQAREICDALPAFVTSVALFVDAEHFVVQDVLNEVPVDLLQFHGSEDAADCAAFAIPYIKAVRMKDDVDVADMAREYRSARGLLVDAYSATAAGGTGESFDWRRIEPEVHTELDTPIILAGGLDPDNVAEAIRQVRPYAIDVSSGVEVARGIKDAAKINAFIEAVREADKA